MRQVLFIRVDQMLPSDTYLKVLKLLSLRCADSIRLGMSITDSKMKTRSLAKIRVRVKLTLTHFDPNYCS